MPFTILVVFHLVSAIISSVTLGLSTVNVGIISIIVNFAAGLASLLFHVIVLWYTWRKGATPARPTFRIAGVSDHIPSVTTNNNTARDSYDQRKQLRIIIPSVVVTPAPVNRWPTSEPLYTFASLLNLIIIEILTLIALGMTINALIGGPAIFLPGERTHFAWNPKVEKAMCVFLSLQLVQTIVGIVVCAIGRHRMSKVEDQEKEAAAYENSAVQDYRSQFPWNV